MADVFYKARIRQAIKEFNELKDAKDLQYKLDKALTNEQNYFLCEATYERVIKEIQNLDNLINEVKGTIREWQDDFKNLPREQRDVEIKQFTDFDKKDSIYSTLEAMIQKSREYNDVQTELQAVTKHCKADAEREQRKELREYNREIEESAKTTEKPSPEMQSLRQAMALYQLPTLEIKPFKGERRNWPAFHEAFKAAVDSKPGNKVEKLNILRSLLQGEAETLIAGMKLTEANYEAAMRLLNDTYGDSDSYIRTLHTELANLKKCQNLEETRKFMLELERIAREMKNAGENIEGPAVYLQLEKKLPRNFLRTILQNKREVNASGEDWDTTQFRKYLIETVNRESDIKEVMEEYGFEKKNPSSSKYSQRNYNHQRNNYAINTTIESEPKNNNQKIGNRNQNKNTGNNNKSQNQNQRNMSNGQSHNNQNKRNASNGKSRNERNLGNGKSQNQRNQTAQNERKGPKCPFCQGTHWGNQYEKYKTPYERKNIARENKLCFRCLRNNHMANECQNPAKCYNCQREHPTAFCRNQRPQNSRSQQMNSVRVEQEQSQSTHSQNNNGQKQTEQKQNGNIMCNIQTINERREDKKVLLMTTECTVFNPWNSTKCEVAKIFIDGGAQRSFITKDLSKKLKLDAIDKENCNLTSFGEKEAKNYETDVVKIGFLCPMGERLILTLNNIKFLVNEMPIMVVSKIDEEILQKRKLKMPEKIESPDILLGMDVYQQLKIREEQTLPSGFSIFNSRIGQILSGNGQIEGNFNQSSHITFLMSTQIEKEIISEKDLKLEEKLSSFFGLNIIGMDDTLEPEDRDEIMRIFKKNITFIDGRYQVGIPFNEKIKELPTNYRQAKARLVGLLKKLKKMNLIKQYDEIIRDQEKDGIIERVEDPTQSNGPVHYLPHRAVIKMDKTTTKIRIVMDPSAKPKGTHKLPSLNECIYPGPILLKELVGILLRFRTMNEVILADIEKAFLQILVRLQDRDCTRFLWVENPETIEPNEDITCIVFRFKRVSFGLNVSPFLLNATIREHLAFSNSILAQIIEKNLYSDNVLINVDETKKEKIKPPTTVEICVEAKEIFKTAGMNLREFLCNKPENLENMPSLELATSQNETKILGIKWEIRSERIIFTYPVFEGKITKRTCLSQLAKFYDPLGLGSPSLLPVKLFMRKVFEANLNWDKELNQDMQKEWKELMATWRTYRAVPCQIDFPRFIGHIEDAQIHCFTDASGKGLGVAIYARVPEKPKPKCNLIFAKSLIKRAQINMKDETIPKMELQAITLGVKFLKFIQKQLDITNKQITLWTDSTCSIERIRNCKKADRFVRNRIEKIRGNYIIKHIDGKTNPADMASRGVTPLDLTFSLKWRSGPEWLSKTENHWPDPIIIYKPGDELNEIETEDVTIVSTIMENEKLKSIIPVENFSKWHKLRRAITYVFRFIKIKSKNYKAKEIWVKQIQDTFKTQGVFEVKELKLGEKYLINMAQIQFPLPENQERNLKIFEENGIQRCMGRLKESNLRWEQKFPIYLPHKARVPKLIIRDIHQRKNHCGILTLLAIIREKYWIIKGRKSLENIIFGKNGCMVCKKFRMKPYNSPEWANLPKTRTNIVRPFSQIGVDYFGPLQIKTNEGNQKIYVVLYTCFVIRAIHLEIAEDYSAEAFIRTFRRFCARRGKPNLVWSDNGTNFVAGAKIIENHWQNAIRNEATKNDIQWSFTIPRAPWKGGVWERLIKIVKNCMKRTIGKSLLTKDEMSTLMCEIEATVNNRPITFMTERQPMKVLRPIDFLIPYRETDTNLPEIEVDMDDPDYKPVKETETKENLEKMMQKANNRINKFWKLWKRDYLISLREKDIDRNNPGKEPKEGDIVIIEQEEIPRSIWQTGQIIELIKERDKHARSAVVFTNGKTKRRAINQLYPLEIENTNSEEKEQNNSIIMPIKIKPKITKWKIIFNGEESEALVADHENGSTIGERKVKPEWKIYHRGKEKYINILFLDDPDAINYHMKIDQREGLRFGTDYMCDISEHWKWTDDGEFTIFWGYHSTYPHEKIFLTPRFEIEENIKENTPKEKRRKNSNRMNVKLKPKFTKPILMGVSLSILLLINLTQSLARPIWKPTFDLSQPMFQIFKRGEQITTETTTEITTISTTEMTIEEYNKQWAIRRQKEREYYHNRYLQALRERNITNLQTIHKENIEGKSQIEIADTTTQKPSTMPTDKRDLATTEKIHWSQTLQLTRTNPTETPQIHQQIYTQTNKQTSTTNRYDWHTTKGANRRETTTNPPNRETRDKGHSLHKEEHKPVYWCTHKGGTIWRFTLADKNPFCRPPPSFDWKWKKLNIHLYGKITQPKKVTNPMQCAMKYLKKSYYVNLLGDKFPETPKKEFQPVNKQICLKMIEDKTCPGEKISPMIQIEGKKRWESQNNIDEKYPGRLASLISGPNEAESTNCFLQEITLFYRPHNLQLISPTLELDDCHYQYGFCLLNDNTSIIWEPNCEKNNCQGCEYEYIESMEGKGASPEDLNYATWLSDSHEQALTFQRNAQITQSCNGIKLRISDQGFAITILYLALRCTH